MGKFTFETDLMIRSITPGDPVGFIIYILFKREGAVFKVARRTFETTLVAAKMHEYTADWWTWTAVGPEELAEVLTAYGKSQASVGIHP